MVPNPWPRSFRWIQNRVNFATSGIWRVSSDADFISQGPAWFHGSPWQAVGFQLCILWTLSSTCPIGPRDSSPCWLILRIHRRKRHFWSRFGFLGHVWCLWWHSRPTHTISSSQHTLSIVPPKYAANKTWLFGQKPVSCWGIVINLWAN